MAQGRSVFAIPSAFHPCVVVFDLFHFTFYFSLLFYFLFLSFFLMTDGDSMTTNNLRDSANGTFVTLDDYLPFTGYEPNAMELTNVTEFNDSVLSNFTDFQDSLVHIAPSSDHKWMT